MHVLLREVNNSEYVLSYVCGLVDWDCVGKVGQPAPRQPLGGCSALGYCDWRGPELEVS